VERRAIKRKLANIAFSMKAGKSANVIAMDHRYLILKVDGMRPAGEVQERGGRLKLRPRLIQVETSRK